MSSRSRNSKSASTKSTTTTRRFYPRYGSYRRPSNYYSGRGGYKFVSASGHLEGSAKLPGIGSIGGGVSGQGGWANKKEVVPYLSGLGAYKVSDIKRNVLIKPDPPRVYNSTDGHGVTIRHREFIQNIVTATTPGEFKIDVFPLNPGVSNTFPWLSSIASSFEEFSFEGLIFEFQSTASDAIASSTNLALGSVMMATQYDPLNPPFTTSQSMLNYDWSENAKVSETKLHFVECDPKQNVLGKYFVRDDAETDGTDLRFTDMGNFSIATEGLQGADVQVGRLWCTYQVRFSKPKLNISQIETAGGNFFKYAVNAGFATSTPFGTISSGEIAPESNLSISLSYNGSNGRITFPNSPYGRTFQILYANRANGIFAATQYHPPTVAAVNQCQQITVFDSNTLGAIFAPSSSGIDYNQTQLIVFYVTILPNSNGAYVEINLSDSIVGSDPSTVDIHVLQVPYLDTATY